MLEIKIFANGKREIVATEGVVCRKGNTPSPDIHRMQMLPTDTIENFEEVIELPKYTEQEYKTKVQELIALKYSIGDEIALLNNLKDDKEEHLIEYDEYMKYREECKIRAKEILNNEV